MVKRIGTVRSKRDEEHNRKFLPNDAIKKDRYNEKSDCKVKAALGINGGREREGE